MTTKEKPSKFDCYANAKPDEPMFILLGRDPCAGLLVRFWCMLRIAMDLGNEDQINEAFECATELDQWAKGLGKEALINKLITLVNEMQPKIYPKTNPSSLYIVELMDNKNFPIAKAFTTNSLTEATLYAYQRSNQALVELMPWEVPNHYIRVSVNVDGNISEINRMHITRRHVKDML